MSAVLLHRTPCVLYCATNVLHVEKWMHSWKTPLLLEDSFCLSLIQCSFQVRHVFCRFMALVEAALGFHHSGTLN